MPEDKCVRHATTQYNVLRDEKLDWADCKHRKVPKSALLSNVSKKNFYVLCTAANNILTL